MKAICYLNNLMSFYTNNSSFGMTIPMKKMSKTSYPNKDTVIRGSGKEIPYYSLGGKTRTFLPKFEESSLHCWVDMGTVIPGQKTILSNSH
jgi:hypothetical protein